MESLVPIAEVPDHDGPFMHILEFALTYNAYQRLCSEDLGRLVSPVTRQLDKSGEPPEWAGVDLLRGALFWLQRKAHWQGTEPVDEVRMRALVRAIARRLGEFPLVRDASV